MASVYGVNKTLKRAGSVNTIEPELLGGKVKWLYDQYVAAGLATGSTIELFGHDIPAEARIVDWIIDHDGLASAAVDLSLGTKADVEEFMASTSSYAADKKNFTDDGIAGSLGFEIAAGTGQEIVITTTGASAATGTIRVAIAYVAKG